MKNKILFLCTGNSARSIMAEGIANSFEFDDLSFQSAGSDPVGEVNPFCIKTLKKFAISKSYLRSKSWEEFNIEKKIRGSWSPDIIVTLCQNAEETSCPVWLGDIPKISWNLDDPAIFSSEDEAMKAFENIFIILSLRFQFLKDAIASTEFIAKKKEFQDLKKSDRRNQISLVICNYLIEAAND